MKYRTIREAAERWVNEMDFIRTDLIKDAIREKEYVWNELTPLTVGTEVFCREAINLSGDVYKGYGRIVKICDGSIVVKMFDTDENVLVNEENVEEECKEYFPMWGTMFRPKETFYEDWM